MKIFFPDFKSLMQFCLQINIQSVKCPYCHQSAHFILHDFIYKNKIVVGKRLFCSNRNNHAGCGRTIRLYISHRIPQLIYSSVEVTAFLLVLINGQSITQAYQDATGCADPRNAYRWLDKLQFKLSEFRQYLSTPCEQSGAKFINRVKRFRLLLPTVERLFNDLPQHSCACFQEVHQKAFF